MDEIEDIVKFLPCSIDNVCEVEEWLDAMSEEGYLLKEDTINLLFGIFEKKTDQRRYYYHVVTGMKSKDDQSVFRLDEKTIKKYEDQKLKYVGKTCGYYLFRTDRLSVIQNIVDDSEKTRKINYIKHNIYGIVVLSIFSVIIFHGLNVFEISEVADVIAKYVLFFLVMILMCIGVEIYGTFEDLKDENKLKPTYARNVRVCSCKPELIFKSLYLIAIVLFLVLILLQDLSMKL